MRRVLGVFLFLTILPCLRVEAQDTPSEMHQHLGPLVGSWTYVVGEGSGVYECEWLGGYWLECDEVYTDSSGTTVKILGVWGYDAQAGVFRWWRYWGDGASDSSTGSIADDTWIFTSQEKDGLRNRITMTVEPSGSVSFFWEESSDGGPWERSLEGRMTKIR